MCWCKVVSVYGGRSDDDDDDDDDDDQNVVDICDFVRLMTDMLYILLMSVYGGWWLVRGVKLCRYMEVGLRMMFGMMWIYG